MIENFNNHVKRKVKNEFKYLKDSIIDLEYGMRIFHKKLDNIVNQCNYIYSDNYDYNSDTSDEMESQSFASSNCSDILPDVIAVKKIHESKDLGSIHSKPKKKRNKNKNLPIQDLKNCCSLDNIWKTEVIREIRKRLIVDCTFIDSKTTVKALIDPKSQYNSISKALAKKMDLYISRDWGSRYPAVEKLGVGATNAGKKVMMRGWTDKENISVSLPNIFELKPPSYLGKSYMYFVVIDKPEYDLVLGNGEVILIEFSDQNVENTSIDLSEYYDSEYSETESESSDSKTESEFSDSETESEFSDFISVLRSFRDNSLNYRLA
ncbi:hypothetical protein Glove_578g6 [Diversispora epigaea]|uniref:Uncharacterized protein n=1 Tax=Diversispora epigaea TaxID=1348612 RepID=A0A397GEW7_9GLOM|nr:hypothetical protein Glove_578g6 [Diversispora epigaea]